MRDHADERTLSRLTDEYISFYLCCGFFPDFDKNIQTNLFAGIDLELPARSRAGVSLPEEDLVEEGTRILRQLFLSPKGERIIVPLSGGLDSRTVLAGLVNKGYKEKITVVTFGVPDSYDFEIGGLVARRFGVQQMPINLNEVPVTLEQLLEHARNGGAWTFLFDSFYNNLICREFGKDAVYWTGFMGGELGGSRVPLEESLTWDQARRVFVKKYTACPSITLCRPGHDPADSLPSVPAYDRTLLSFDDQLHFAKQQHLFLERIIRSSGCTFQIPFLNPEWVTFMLGIPREYRIKKYLYKKILQRAFPEFFRLPTSNNTGGRLGISPSALTGRLIVNRLYRYSTRYPSFLSGLLNPFRTALHIHQRHNYVDYDDVIRTHSDYRQLIGQCISDLAGRDVVPWLDPEAVLADHRAGRGNYGIALFLLTALEISLKVNEDI
ncbi:hypothetical protein JXO52_10190 [bacterium]|nr:hypothetical protein [bacterium]